MKTSIFIATGLDGFIARHDGNIDWLSEFESKDVFTSYNGFIEDIDAVVIGRGTFETAISFPSWPYSRPVFVLSTMMNEVPAKLKEKANVVSMRPGELLAYLQDKGYSSLYIDGGKVIQGFLQEDLIDEMTITKVPILIGRGIPLFGQLDRDLHFNHVETKTFENGLVRSRYGRRRG